MRPESRHVPPQRLVREVRKALDTPALISLLAEDNDLLQAVLRVLNPASGADAGFLDELDRVCHEENTTVLDLKRRLASAAAALGLPVKSEDRSEGLYEILDVPFDASESVIRRAYRSRALELHPDTNPDADPVHFARLVEAYRVLAHPELRERYDAGEQKKPYWVENSRVFREEADRKESLRRRQRRRVAFQLIAALGFLLVLTGFADHFFKEQALREGQPLREAPATTQGRLLPDSSGEAPKSVAPQIKALDPLPGGRTSESEALAQPGAESEQGAPPPSEPGKVEPSAKTGGGKDLPSQPVVSNTGPGHAETVSEKLGVPAEDYKTTQPAEPAGDNLKQIQDFIASYCGAYEALSYDRFMGHFAPDALQNDGTVKELQSSYRSIFDSLQALVCDIEVKHYTTVNDQCELTGDYVLRWRFKGAGWQERQGPIFMALVPAENTFRVKRLVYR